jgi:hypothetical protein
VAAAPPSATQTVTLLAVADSYVSSDAPDTNFGSGPAMNVDGQPVAISYLSFDLSPYAGRDLRSATLRLRVSTSGSTGTQRARLVDVAWSETGLTYRNRPSPGAALGGFGPTSVNTTYGVTLDATALRPRLGGRLSIALDATHSDGVDLATRETANPPQLVLVLGA